MRRRGFLGLIGAALAGAVMDPDRALWVPRKRLISIPKPTVTSPEGMSIRHIRQFDARQGVWLDRCDALYGFGAEHVSNNVRISA